jgi:AraC-like DNA-binding protein
LDLAAEALGDELLGFRLAQGFDLREIGLLYYVMASSELLGDALQRCAHYCMINNEGVRILYRTGDHAAVEFKYVGVPRHTDRHEIEFFVTTLVRICHQLTARKLRPERVMLSHVSIGSASDFRSHFGCGVTFGGPRDEIIFPKAIGEMPLRGADPFLNKLLLKYCDEARSARATEPSALRSRVENAIAPLLPHRKIHASEISQGLGLSRRTLDRRLAAEGLTFAGIVQELRCDLAKRYLRETGLPVSRIAWLLGYEEVSSFTHAFKRWTGKAPKEAR